MVDDRLEPMGMAQGVLTEAEVVQVKEKGVEEEGLTVCNSCRHLVPRTMVCLYCGAPILLRKPRTARAQPLKKC